MKKEICNECGKSVQFCSGRYTNRVIDLNDRKTREEMNKPFPEGDYICAECELARRINHKPEEVLPFARKISGLAFYQRQLKGKRCRWCDTRIENQPLQSYEHHGGYQVEGFEQKQWLYVTCPKCKYQWSAVKLGIKEAPASRKRGERQ